MSNEAFEKWAIEYDFEITLHKNSSSTYKEYDTHCAWLGWQAAKADSEQEIAKLKANINVLRDDLDCAYYEVNHHFAENIKDLLASTPAQSLQEHDNEVIEKCAKVCDAWSLIGKSIAHDVRALKG